MAGERVLLIEDSLVYRDLTINHILKPNGYGVLVATDGEMGVEMALREAPDLILLDLHMPKLNGLEVLMRLHENGCNIPVILTTLHGSEQLAVEVFRLGVKDYVIKPFSPEELLDAMERSLREVRLQREKESLTQQLIAINQELDAKIQLLDNLLKNTQNSIILVSDDESQHILLANRTACDTFNLDGEIIDQPLVNVSNDELLINAFRHSGTSNDATDIEIPLVDGRILNAHITHIPSVGLVAVMHDISYLKELDRMKSEFVSTVSHDLRSPITSIKGYASLVSMAGPLNEQQKEFIDRIQGNADTTAELIADLLDLGRIETESRAEIDLCDMCAIINKSLETLRDHARLKHQTIEQDLPTDIPRVLGSKIRLTQAMGNLISNAIKYTHDEGKISISAKQDDGYVLIQVKDNGIGIPVSDLPFIFDKFFRVKNEDTDGIPGSGLGLSLVKSIIEKHQGRIWVESQRGAGSTFTVLLPAATQLTNQ
jgi:two-component system, OmpR family, phosphate regulon sensor histidine kinase PhoR